MTGRLRCWRGFGQGRPQLLNPAQDRPAPDVNPLIREDASDPLGRDTQLKVVADSEQDDVAREAMT